MRRLEWSAKASLIALAVVAILFLLLAPSAPPEIQRFLWSLLKAVGKP